MKNYTDIIPGSLYEKKIYSEPFIVNLFNKMSSSYEQMNSWGSLGFYPLWRKQAINKITIKKGASVTDLLTGAGECWHTILKKSGISGKLIALDFSQGMLHCAVRRKAQYPEYYIQVLQESVFNNTIPSQSQDVVICCYGIKTFTQIQIDAFAKEIYRILKPDGQFTLVEVSLPKNTALKKCYLFYIGKVIPLLGRVFLKDKSSYKMLGVYAKKFRNMEGVVSLFTANGFAVTYSNYFLGCATGIYGSKSK